MECVDSAIVGAGITGLSVALHLVERGESSVVLYERTAIGAGASGVQPGGIRMQWGTEVNCRMARESLDFYLELNERLRTRVDPRFRPCGYMFLAHSTEALVRLAGAIVGDDEGDVLRTLSFARFARGELVPEPAVV